MIIGLDFDGTLVDSSNRHVILLNDICEAEGLAIDLDNYLLAKGDGRSTKSVLQAKGLNSDLVNKISHKWIEQIESEHYLDFDCLKQGALEFLEMLKNDGHQLHLITARKNKSGLYSQISRFGINSYFESICVVSPLNARMEKTEALSMLNIDLMIGDTEVDYLSAKESGALFLRIRSPFRSDSFFNNQNYLVDSSDSLKEIYYKILKMN